LKERTLRAPPLLFSPGKGGRERGQRQNFLGARGGTASWSRRQGNGKETRNPKKKKRFRGGTRNCTAKVAVTRGGRLIWKTGDVEERAFAKRKQVLEMQRGEKKRKGEKVCRPCLVCKPPPEGTVGRGGLSSWEVGAL